MRDIQREFDRHPIRVPLEADMPSTPGTRRTDTTIYNGPIILGSADGARLTWNSRDVNQSQSQTEQVVAGFEPLAQAVVSTLERLQLAGLADRDRNTAEEAANEILSEVVTPVPDRSKISRSLSVLKGVLAPVALGLSVGAAEGAQDWARTAIEQLGTPF